MRNTIPGEAFEWTQNGWAGKGSPDVIWANPPAQAGPPRPSYPGPRPVGFWVSPRMMTPQPAWPSWASAHPDSKKCFLMFRGSLLHLFLPIAFSPVIVTHCKEPGSAFSPSLQVSICIDQIPLSLLFSMLKCKLSQLWLIGKMLHLSSSLWPFLSVSPVCPCLFCTKEPRNEHSSPGVASLGLSGSKGSPPLPCWQYFG